MLWYDLFKKIYIMKKNQYQELVEFISEQFEFIAGQFQVIHQELDILKIKVDKIDIKVDNLTKMVKDLQDDNVIINHRLEVLEEKVLR